MPHREELATLRRIVPCLAALWLVAVLVPAEAAAAPTTARITASFSPNRLGARTKVSFGIKFGGGESGVPSPVRRAVVKIPGGLILELPDTRGCSLAHLRARGARGCPARSQVGRGQALVEVHTGATIEYERATVWAFMGTLASGQEELEILGQGYTPLERRVVFNTQLESSEAPYWDQLVAQVPPIPSIPLEPDASPVSFSVTIGYTGRSRGEIGIYVPGHCPSGGFPWAAEFTYADGSTSSTTFAAPCP